MMSISAGACAGAAALGGTAGGVRIGGLAATGIGIAIGVAVYGVYEISKLCWTRAGQANEAK
jgi:uncharacterized membrane protein